MRPNVAATRLGACAGQQIDISAFNELRRLNAKLGHEIVSFLNTCFCWLALLEDYFQLQEVPQVLDSIEVHSCTPDYEERAVLLNSACLPIGLRQSLAQRSGRGGWRTKIERLFWALLVCPAIEDEFAFFF